MTNALVRIALLCVFLCAPLGALAQETQVGTGLICDTATQVARYIELYKKGDNTTTVVQAVNTEANSVTACGIALIAFVEGDEVAKVRGPMGTARVVKITIVAVNLGRGWQPTAPFEQYTALIVPEQGI